MRVLSIDLDYIMYPSAPIFSNKNWDNHPISRWYMFNEAGHCDQSELIYDDARLKYLKNIFEKALEFCSNVEFAYEHDSILYSIRGYENIELINIDHHDDVLMANYSFYDSNEVKNYNLELKFLEEHDNVNEGCWIGWLHVKKKLKSLRWIGNNNFIEDIKENFISALIPDYEFITHMDYDFGNYKFDHIFICLSPQYIPPHHWHVFKWFIEKYESRYNKKVNLKKWETKKIQIDYRYKEVSNAILH